MVLVFYFVLDELCGTEALSTAITSQRRAAGTATLIFMPELEVEWTPLIHRDLSLTMHDGRLQTQSAYNGFLLQDGTRVYPPIGKDQRATHTPLAGRK